MAVYRFSDKNPHKYGLQGHKKGCTFAPEIKS